MRHTISATELARSVGDILGRVRYRGDSFVVEKNGVAVAHIEPVAGAEPCTLAEAMAVWSASGEPDAEFADALERVGKLDPLPENPWDS